MAPLRALGLARPGAPVVRRGASEAWTPITCPSTPIRRSRITCRRPGAVDAHCHVFGPEAKFPFAPERKYTPCDAPKEKLFALRDFLGFAAQRHRAGDLPRHRQPALVDALADVERQGARRRRGRRQGQRRANSQALDRAGVRGVRFNFLPRLVDATPRDVFLGIAERIEPLGWHTVVYFEAPSSTTHDARS